MVLDLRDLYLSLLTFICSFEETEFQINRESLMADELVQGGSEWVLYSHIQRIAEQHPALTILHAMENAGSFSRYTATVVETLRNRAFDDLITQQSMLGRLEYIFSTFVVNKPAYQSEEVKYA